MGFLFVSLHYKAPFVLLYYNSLLKMPIQVEMSRHNPGKLVFFFFFFFLIIIIILLILCDTNIKIICEYVMFLIVC
jgi:hypothetical protein